VRRSVVGLLAAVGATASVLATLVHGVLVPADAVAAGLVTGLGVYLSQPPKKKSPKNMAFE
jgi:hypothetical protein